MAYVVDVKLEINKKKKNLHKYNIYIIELRWENYITQILKLELFFIFKIEKMYRVR